MVSPVDEAIATSEIAEDSNIVAEGHQDNQYGNWSGAAEGVVATTTDTAMGIIDEMLDVPTDVMPAIKKAITSRTKAIVPTQSSAGHWPLVLVDVSPWARRGIAA